MEIAKCNRKCKNCCSIKHSHDSHKINMCDYQCHLHCIDTRGKHQQCNKSEDEILKIIKANKDKNLSISGFGAPRKYPQPIRKYYITQPEINELTDDIDPKQYDILPAILESRHGKQMANLVMHEIRSRGGNNINSSGNNPQANEAYRSRALQYRAPIKQHNLVRESSTGEFLKIVQNNEKNKHGSIKTLQEKNLKFPISNMDPSGCKTYCFKKCNILLKGVNKKNSWDYFKKITQCTQDCQFHCRKYLNQKYSKDDLNRTANKQKQLTLSLQQEKARAFSAKQQAEIQIKIEQAQETLRLAKIAKQKALALKEEREDRERESLRLQKLQAAQDAKVEAELIAVQEATLLAEEEAELIAVQEATLLAEEEARIAEAEANLDVIKSTIKKEVAQEKEEDEQAEDEQAEDEQAEEEQAEEEQVEEQEEDEEQEEAVEGFSRRRYKRPSAYKNISKSKKSNSNIWILVGVLAILVFIIYRSRNL